MFNAVTHFVEFLEIGSREPRENTTNTLTVSTFPRNAQVSILGTDVAYKKGVELKEGKYQIKVEAPDYKTKVQEVLVKGNSRVYVFLDRASEWLASTEKSPIDDSTNVFLSTIAEKPISGWLTQKTRPLLHIRCKENKTNVFIDLGVGPENTSGSYGDKYAFVTFRFDNDKARKEKLGVSTDRKALFFSGRHIPTAKKMMKHERLLITFTPSNSVPQTTTFDLKGLSDKIKPLRKACHW
jgi:type VI secretion system protein VasI